MKILEIENRSGKGGLAILVSETALDWSWIGPGEPTLLKGGWRALRSFYGVEQTVGPTWNKTAANMFQTSASADEELQRCILAQQRSVFPTVILASPWMAAGSAAPGRATPIVLCPSFVPPDKVFCFHHRSPTRPPLSSISGPAAIPSPRRHPR